MLLTKCAVNGIRNPFGYQPWREQRTFQAMFDILESDIVVMQETKIQRKDLQDDMVLVPGWDVFFSLPKHKKGYSGVAIYTRNASCSPIRAEEGITGVLCPPKSTSKFRDLPLDQRIGGYPRPGQLSGLVEDTILDSEGRCVVLEFPAFVLLGVYCPANRDESRVEFRTSFFEALDVRIRNLVAEGKEVILAGDLNVIRSEMDSTNVVEGLRKENMTLDEWISLPTRRIFNQLIFEGSIIGDHDEGRESSVLWDLCRCFHPSRRGMNTCWDTKRNTRPANNGSRIDYILCSDGIKDWFTWADIQEGLMGSDHCPVFATIADKVVSNGRQVSLGDIMNPAGVYKNGVRMRDLTQKDILPLSAKLIPEFDRRQSIRDMFFKKVASAERSTTRCDSESSSFPAEDVSQASDNDAPSQIDTAPQTANTGTPGTEPAGLPNAQARKRCPDPIDAVPRQLKRSKSGADPTGSKQKASQGQSTLKGFFRPVGSALAAPAASPNLEEQNSARDSRATRNLPAAKEDSDNASLKGLAIAVPEKSARDGIVDTMPKSPDRVFDPIEAKESWSKLLGKRVIPRCEHDEPCISLVTKKPGVNRAIDTSDNKPSLFLTTSATPASQLEQSRGARHQASPVDLDKHYRRAPGGVPAKAAPLRLDMSAAPHWQRCYGDGAHMGA
ncbi:DNA lyase [Metarhizium album ARSEF 1941]|uniref:DNA lyase n=2 Tax=Metarhizium album TaxID=92629 RepID=A0A0B2X5D0_METAS|nr:DNA lyase [Metarhizium album ARSEF 1941]KHO00963.1 DNA lyase [Metarhizium album ARSEF 1941]